MGKVAAWCTSYLYNEQEVLTSSCVQHGSQASKLKVFLHTYSTHVPFIGQQSSSEVVMIMTGRALVRDRLDLLRWVHSLLDRISAWLKLPYLDDSASFTSTFSNETERNETSCVLCELYTIYIVHENYTFLQICYTVSPDFFDRTFPQVQSILKFFSYMIGKFEQLVNDTMAYNLCTSDSVGSTLTAFLGVLLSGTKSSSSVTVLSLLGVF